MYDLIIAISELRDIPQFLYSWDISLRNTNVVREKLMEKYILKNKAKQKEIDFILNSPGGSPADAYRIIKILHQYYEKVNIVIPFWAKSAATLLSLGGNEIIMDNLAEFWPLDMQIGKEEDDGSFSRESALNDESSVRQIEKLSQQQFFSMFHTAFNNRRIWINKSELSNQILNHVAQFYQPLMDKINPYKLWEKRRQLDVAKMYADFILTQFSTITQDKQDLLIDFLVHRCPDHGFILDYNLLKEFWLPVRPPESISEEYSVKLAELSLFFMKQDIDYIWFIENNDPDNVIKENEVNSWQE